MNKAMDLLDFINNYWTILAGIASFIFMIAYLQNSNTNITKDMTAQKEEHDKQIAELKTDIKLQETRLNEHKDKMTDSMGLIQQDIREIMTILKQNNK